MRIFSQAICALALGAASFSAVSAPAGAAELIDNFNDWSAFADDATLCYAGSAAQREQGNYSKRGDALVLVTHRPKDKTYDVVSIQAGYTYKEGSTVEVLIGGHSFELFTEGGYAWAHKPEDDAALVRAMKAGSEMVVRGTSNRGTDTVDTYSLMGFTAAYNAASKTCNVKR